MLRKISLIKKLFKFIIIFQDTEEKSKEISATLDKSSEVKSEESTTSSSAVVKIENDLSLKIDTQDDSTVSKILYSTFVLKKPMSITLIKEKKKI